MSISLEEIMQLLDSATTLDAVGDIFRLVFSPGFIGKFTKKSFRAGEIVEHELDRFSVKNPTSVEAFDFLNMTIYCDQESFEDNETYKRIIEQGRAVKDYNLLFSLRGEGDFFSTEIDKMFPGGPIKVEVRRKELAKQIRNLYSDWNLVTGKGRRLSVRDGSITDDYFELDREMLGEQVAEILAKEFPEKTGTIASIVSGRLSLGCGRDKKERLLLKRINEVREECFLKTEGLSTQFQELRDKIAKTEQIVREESAKVFNEVTNALNEASGITQEEAEIWAENNVYIEKNVAKKLDDILYPESQLRKDIAELYRYVGGKLGPVEFILERGNKRAWAKGRSQICLDHDFNKTTLFHECGHLVEAWDRAAFKASQAFIKSRAKDNPKPLRELAHSGYRADEKAYPDNFIDPYVGKIYPDATEVFSMALQQMADPKSLVTFMVNDLEHFNLMLGQCLHKNPMLAEKTRELMEEVAVKSDILADKKEKTAVFLKSLDKAVLAISPYFENMLLDTSKEGDEGLCLRKSGKTGFILLWRHKNFSGESTLYSGGKKDSLRAAYLCFLCLSGNLPLKFSLEDRRFRSTIIDWATGTAIPEWFDGQNPNIPPLNLGDNFRQQVQDAKSQAKTEVARKKAFKGALERAVPAWLPKRLEKDGPGFEGYTIFPYLSGKGDIYSEHVPQKYLTSDTYDVCLQIVYLLIMNYRGLLPLDYGRDSRAVYSFQKFATGNMVPDWFDASQGLPELKE